VKDDREDGFHHPLKRGHLKMHPGMLWNFSVNGRVWYPRGITKKASVDDIIR
jgi:hypothetical protein